MRRNKEILSVYILTAVSLFGLIPLLFSGDSTYFFGYILDNDAKVDVYWLSDKLRYPENVAYDVVEMITISVFVWTVSNLTENAVIKKYINCFLWVSLINLGLYFVNYNSFSSFITMPLLMLSLIIVKITSK